MESIKNDKNMNKKGIGLGLCICKIITNEFDGEITV
jgi:K+-sensing histidine kinase KdpD